MVSTIFHKSSRFIHTVADGIEVGLQPPCEDDGSGGGSGDDDDCFEDEESFFGSLFCSLKQ